MTIAADVLETIGTPLVAVGGPAGATVAAKLEAFNPGGSAKDRPARAMVAAAERRGDLSPGDRLVEATSGNTGIGLAMVCAVRGYDLSLVVPASKSVERRRLLRAYGADLELVDGDIEAARERADEIAAGAGAYRVGQFDDEANPRAHYETTGPEILDAVGDRTVDAFVATVGTGGTITGTARRLREAHSDLTVVAVEPAENAVLSSGEAGDDEYQGMGPGFVAPNLDTSLLDRVETVPLDEAEAECRRLASGEGILAGQSSGAASLAARSVARDLVRDAGADDSDPAVDGPAAGVGDPQSGSTDSDADEPLVVTVFPDSGERYLTTGMFDTPADD